jgi:ATP-binding cassette subfamily C protein CydD
VGPVDRRLLREAGAARGYLAVAAGLGLAGAALILLQAGLLSRALAGAARGTGAGALAAVLAWLAVVLAGRAVTAAGGEAAALRAASVVKSGLRRRLSAHALRLGPRWLSGQQAGEITTLATKGLDALDAYFSRYLPRLVLAVVVPLAVLVRVAFADWISAVIIAITLPLIPVFAILIGWHTRAQTRRQWQLLARLGGHFLDVVAGLPTLKLFGRAKAQADVIKQVTGTHRAATMATLRVAFLSALALELTAALATALVAVEIGLRLLAGHVGYQTALLVLLLTPEAGDADLSREDIVVRAVSLAYPGRGRPALDDINLTIRPGEHILLTGPSGAGKSSLLALLLGLATPGRGTIVAGGTDLARIPADRWLLQVAWVPQHPHLFATTVAGNIALGQPGARRPEITAAARLAGADDFISRLPGGYDTVLAEGARDLSSGQRQKIALARAFLRRAPVLLLDEPTAHLDPASADRVMTAIKTQMADRTVVIVTHRPPRSGRALRTLLLDDGRLTDAGARPQDHRAGLAAAP